MDSRSWILKTWTESLLFFFKLWPHLLKSVEFSIDLCGNYHSVCGTSDACDGPLHGKSWGSRTKDSRILSFQMLGKIIYVRCHFFKIKSSATSDPCRECSYLSFGFRRLNRSPSKNFVLKSAAHVTNVTDLPVIPRIKINTCISPGSSICYFHQSLLASSSSFAVRAIRWFSWSADAFSSLSSGIPL